MKKILSIVPYLIIAIFVGVTVSYAGSLTPPGSPVKTMKSLSDLYELVNTGADTPSVDFTTPDSISATMNSIEDIYDLLTTKISDIDDTKILTGTTIFGVEGSASAGTPPTEWAAADMPGVWQSWTAGNAYCIGLGGGWRLPHLWELSKIALEGYTTGSPGLGGSTGLSGYYWSDTTSGASSAYYVGMNSSIGVDTKTTPDYFVRCAR